MRKVVELTYRTRACDKRYVVEMAERLVGMPVVIRMKEEKGPWKTAKLLAVYSNSDRFRVSWNRRGKQGPELRGIWRIHNARLFTEGKTPRPRGLPHAIAPAIVRDTVKHTPREGSKMATKPKAKAGRPKSNGVSSLSESAKKALAKKIATMRKNKEKWDGKGGICDQLDIPNALVGRQLLRDYGDDSLIREKSSGGGSTRKAAKPKPKASGSKAKPAAKRKVTVKRGRGKASNPS